MVSSFIRAILLRESFESPMDRSEARSASARVSMRESSALISSRRRFARRSIEASAASHPGRFGSAATGCAANVEAALAIMTAIVRKIFIRASMFKK